MLFNDYLKEEIEEIKKERELIQHSLDEEIAQIKEKYAPALKENKNKYYSIEEKKRGKLYTYLKEVIPEGLKIKSLIEYGEIGLSFNLINDSFYIKFSLLPNEEHHLKESFIITCYVGVFDEDKLNSDVDHKIIKMIEKIKSDVVLIKKNRVRSVFNKDFFYVKKSKPKYINLTELEKKVFRLYASEESYEEIGKKVGKTRKCVDNTMQRIYRKLDIGLPSIKK